MIGTLGPIPQTLGGRGATDWLPVASDLVSHAWATKLHKHWLSELPVNRARELPEGGVVPRKDSEAPRPTSHIRACFPEFHEMLQQIMNPRSVSWQFQPAGLEPGPGAALWDGVLNQWDLTLCPGRPYTHRIKLDGIYLQNGSCIAGKKSQRFQKSSELGTMRIQ